MYAEGFFVSFVKNVSAGERQFIFITSSGRFRKGSSGSSSDKK